MKIQTPILLGTVLLQTLAGCGSRKPDVSTPSPSPSASSAPVTAQVSGRINPTLETNDAVLAEVQRLEKEGTLTDVVVMESYPVQISAKGPADVIKRLQDMAAGQTQSATNVPFETISKRTSRIEDAGTRVVADDASFATLWLQHNGSSQQKPEVDFNKQTVIAVFAGQKKTGGYDIEITKIVQTGKTLEVTYHESSPAPDSLTTQVLTSPSHLVTINLSKANGDFDTVTFTAS